MKAAALPGMYDVPETVVMSPPLTFTERLAAYFKARPGEWINGLELARVAGAYAWRSRCSDLRKPPFNMAIDNRVRRLSSGVKASEYRYVPAATVQA